ncbi:acetylhydrolase [Parahaliea aestuarii]|uniref:Acetylhydrolase n=1 Tax=Parahaliea aestuarii TaxID=1852021 RepID=A0A5C9A3Z0_9GAMM|nr:acetylhydrolase [Parahaliea aestuarii]TXS94490.1 acetylhydrolase [Parahaliea aestuarii]
MRYPRSIIPLLACLLLGLGACQREAPPAGTAATGPGKEEAATSKAGAEAEDYAVGSSTFFIHDDSRPFDAVAGVDTGVRTLVTEVWYPVNADSLDEHSRHPTWGDYVFGDRQVHRRMMTQTTFFHLTPESVRTGVDQAQIDAAINELFERKRPSYRDAKPAGGNTPWPVVVMSHGDAGSRYNMATTATYLASRGYFVIAADHTGNSPYAMIGRDPALDAQSGDPALREKMKDVLPLLDDHGVYGSAETYGQSYTPLAGGFSPAGFGQLDQSLLQRVGDLRAVLDRLDELNRAGRFAGRLDLSRIGLMGRSFGGATTLAGLMLEDRFAAGFAVVPPSMPDLRASLPAGMLVPAPAESAILGAEGPFALNSLHKPTFILSGGEDRLILGLGAQLAKAAGATTPSAESPYPLLASAVSDAPVPAALAVVKDTNHGSFGVSGPFWWPQLKPDTFPRFFDPDSSYTLLAADTAHRIQAEMAAAFFDLTLRGRSSGLDQLRANPWAKHGTSMQMQGFGQ